jgi:hypothetical protein
MNSTATRIYVVTAIILLTYGINRLAGIEVTPPKVVMPAWTFNNLPLQLGNWRGEATKLDPEIAHGTGAQIVVDRLYQDDLRHSVAIHTAMFKEPSVGLTHTPRICYNAHGWRCVSEAYDTLQPVKGLTIPICVTRWEQYGNNIFVVYWYQAGTQVLFSRLDAGELRWKWRGHTQWPPVVKVMLQINIGEDQDDAKNAVMNLAEEIAKWLNQPEHLKYFEQFSNCHLERTLDTDRAYAISWRKRSLFSEKRFYRAVEVFDNSKVYG